MACPSGFASPASVYELAIHPSDPLFPAPIATDILFMQGMFQELWGLCGLLLGVLGVLYLGSLLTASRRGDGGPPLGHGVRHLAVIMDGNRRYGVAKYGVATKGHWDGGRKLGDFVDWCIEAGVEILTVYAFSTENWGRSAAELAALLEVFQAAGAELERGAAAKGVAVRFLTTDPDPVPEDLRSRIRSIEAATRHGTAFRLNVCLSYGGRGEIVGACREVARAVAAGRVAVEDVTEALLRGHLLTGALPDPDLVVRTSGERRISNFLLYQLAYSELAFLDKPWPAITRADLHDLLRTFAHRHRRFGK